MPRYGKKAQDYVEKEVHEYNHHGKWKSRKQAIADGLHEAEEHGVKIPKKNN